MDTVPGHQIRCLPKATTCQNCGTRAAEFVCHICKHPRPAEQRLVGLPAAELKDKAA